MAQLQHRIQRQLTWDPRVVNVHPQRVLMLAESGNSHSIPPARLQNVTTAQRPDGGWSGMDPLLPAGNGRYPGFGGRGFRTRHPASDSHATAQGVLLLSIVTPTVTEQR